MAAPLLPLLLASAVAALPPGASAGPASEGVPRPPSLSARSAALLSVAADARFTHARRAAAVREVGERGDRGAVPKLAALLPGDYGLLTKELAFALGRLGDARALPALEAVAPRAEKEGIDLHGKVNSALHYAIESLKKAGPQR